MDGDDSQMGLGMGMGFRMGMGMWMGMRNGNRNGNRNRNVKGNELLSIFLYYSCPKSYTYSVSAMATYSIRRFNNMQKFSLP